MTPHEIWHTIGLVVGIGAIVLVYLFVWALCEAAARADDAREAYFASLPNDINHYRARADRHRSASPQEEPAP
jgi:hypothetical protein